MYFRLFYMKIYVNTYEILITGPVIANLIYETGLFINE